MPSKKNTIEDLIRRGMPTEQIASRCRTSPSYVRNVRAAMPPEDRQASVEAGAKARARKLRKSGHRYGLLSAMLDDGLSPSEAAERLGLSPSWAREVAASSALGTTASRMKKHRQHHQRMLTARQETRDLRKRSLEPYMLRVMAQLRQLLPPSVWTELIEGRPVTATFEGDYIDDVDQRAELVIDPTCRKVVEHVIEVCEDYESESGREKTGDYVIGIGRMWRSRYYAHGDRARFERGSIDADVEQEVMDDDAA